MNMLRTTIGIICLLIIVCFPGFAEETPTIQCVWTDVSEIVAVGDVHGDFDQFVSIMRKAELIDTGNNWIAGETHLVQTGDILDRGPDSGKVMDLLRRLEDQAAKAGGKVHVLLGNHEAMVMQNDWRYVHPGEMEAQGGEDAYRKVMAPDGKYGSWLLQKNAVIKINETIFVHGGISPEFASIPLHRVNDRIREELSVPTKKWEDSYIKNSYGPLWYRGWAELSDDEIRLLLPGVLKQLNAKRMVIGHTVSKDGIKSRLDGAVVMIDVGMSRAYGGIPACLRIHESGLETITGDGN